MSVRWSIALAVACCCFPSAPLSAAGRAAAQREAAACGPRAVYLLLNHLGIPATYAEIRDAMPLSDQGASIADLQRCVRLYGVDCSIRRCDPSELLEVDVPMIAYLSRIYVGNTAGHFVFVRSMRPSGPETIDPVTGRRDTPWGWQSFSDALSGVCLVVERPRMIDHAPLILAAANFALLFALCYRYIIHRVIRSPCETADSCRSKGWRHQARCCIVHLRPWFLAIRGILLGVVIHASAEPLLAARSSADDGIRSNARGGINSALLMLACTTGNPGYFSFDASAGDELSMEDLRILLHNRGCASAVRQLTMDELSRQGPAILLLRDGPTREGNYYLFLTVREDSVSLVRAGALVVDVVPVDEFRYRWTGHALIVNRAALAPHLGAVVPIGAFCFSVALGATVSFLQLRYLMRNPRRKEQQ